MFGNRNILLTVVMFFITAQAWACPACVVSQKNSNLGAFAVMGFLPIVLAATIFLIIRNIQRNEEKLKN